MALRLIALIAAIATLAMFQNCAKKSSLATSGGSEVSANKVIDGSYLNERSFFLAADPEDEISGTDILTNGLKLTPTTGEIQVQGDSSKGQAKIQAGDRFCLTASEKDQLNALLANDSVCRGLNPLPSDAICAMALVAPYAYYGSETQVLAPVGSANCRKAPDVDFCSGQGEEIKTLLQSVVANLDSHVCP